LSLVAHADRHLWCERYAAVRKFDAQNLLSTALNRGFQKSRPKNPVHLESGPDGAMNQAIELSAWLPCLLGVFGALAVHSSASTKPCARLRAFLGFCRRPPSWTANPL
jgi:hypothetical protein